MFITSDHTDATKFALKEEAKKRGIPFAQAERTIWDKFPTLYFKASPEVEELKQWSIQNAGTTDQLRFFQKDVSTPERERKIMQERWGTCEKIAVIIDPLLPSQSFDMPM